ncbi:MAG: hypothetical protein ACYCT2_07370 [Thermoplasmataceae archaeon]
MTILRLGSLIPAEGLTHSSPLLTENTPLKPMCPCGQSSLTVLLLRGVPYHFRCGQIMHGNGIYDGFALIPPLKEWIFPLMVINHVY